jgi:hypothetical protein
MGILVTTPELYFIQLKSRHIYAQKVDKSVYIQGNFSLKTICVKIVRLDLQEVGCRCEDWIGLAQDRDRWRALVSALRNLRVP